MAQDTLSRAEAELVAYVNAHPESAYGMLQKELALAAGVSKPVVISCFRRLGFEDYRSFLQSIEAFFATQIDSLQASRSVQGRITSVTDLLREAAEVDVRSIQRFSQVLNPEGLKVVVERLAFAPAVYLAGEGTGFYPAHYLYQRLRRYGVRTVMIDQDSRHLPDAVHPMEGGDVLMAFHYSDSDQWLRPLLAHTRKRGVWTFLAAANIHPEYVQWANQFVHVPRGELQFKNSMALPMHYANLVLLAYETVHREAAESRLENLETIRRSWMDATEK